MFDTQQLEFDFDYVDTKNVTQKSTDDAELDDIFMYRVNKYVDFVCDSVPYGWRIYFTYRDIRRWIKSTYQKIRYGVSDEECWNLYSTIAQYILPRLKHFKTMNRMGIPCNMFIKWHPTHKYPGQGNEKDAEQRWNAILDEMIWTFEYILDPDKFLDFPEELSYSNRPADKQNLCDWLVRDKTEREKQLWNQYTTQSELLEQRKKQGLELFAKHYESLWD